MIEIPEAAHLSQQLNRTIRGKRIQSVIAGHSPHKFAWYQGDPARYPDLLAGKTVADVHPLGGVVEIRAGNACIALSEGILFKWLEAGKPAPDRHQLLVTFEDGSMLAASVQMYGGLLAFREGEAENPYYLLARQKPSPLTEAFDQAYFMELVAPTEVQKLSAKAALATEQRIPGLGNGVLQDILYHAGIHPKRAIGTLTDAELEGCCRSVKKTLADMAAQGGRDTEKDLFGQPGGYATRCSKLTAGKPCAACGSPIRKVSFMGGSVYFCETCQPLPAG